MSKTYIKSIKIICNSTEEKDFICKQNYIIAPKMCTGKHLCHTCPYATCNIEFKVVKRNVAFSFIKIICSSYEVRDFIHKQGCIVNEKLCEGKYGCRKCPFTTCNIEFKVMEN